MKRICNFLINSGFEVSLVCRHKSKTPEDIFDERINIFQLSSTSFFSKRKEIQKFINDIKPDIVHTHYLAKDSLIPALMLKRKFKYYISVWGSDINLYGKNWKNRIIQNLALLLCDKIHLLSSFFKKKILEDYLLISKQKIICFSWGVDFSFFNERNENEIKSIKEKLQIADGDFIVLSFRNHKKIYNHHLTIKAMPSVVKIYPTVKFIFTRGSCDRVYLEQSYDFIKKYKLRNNFIFIDKWIPDSKLAALIHISQISISIPFVDGLPASLLEIMSTCSIPIISNLENYQEFFRDGLNGFTVSDLNNPAELAEKILFIISNYSDISKNIIKANNGYIKNYQNWKIQSNILTDLYK
jgi:glycosyltransferase involved in cell wall biosynthesis